MKEIIEIFEWLYPGFLAVFILTFLIRDLDWKKDLFGAFVYSNLTMFIVDTFSPFLQKIPYLSLINGHKFLFSSLVAIILSVFTIWLLSFKKLRGFIIRSRNELFMTAWDAAWKKMSTESPVICEVYLKGASIPVVGIFSSESISSFSNRKDGIYLEKLLFWDRSLKNIQIDPSSLGAFISHDEIAYIKFYKLLYQGGNNGKENKR